MAWLALTSTSQIYYLMRERGLPYARCGGRYRFNTHDLDAWMHGTTALEQARARRRA